MWMTDRCNAGGGCTICILSKLSLLPWLPRLAVCMEFPMAWPAEELAAVFSYDWLAMLRK